MPKRFPKRYLFLAFAACIGLLSLLDLLHTPAEADALDRLHDSRQAIRLSAGVSLTG